MQTKYIAFAVSFAGVLFSGYQSAVKFFSQRCAIDACPYFLGYPACYFGFALFLGLAILSLLVIFQPQRIRVWANSLLVVAIAGVLFAGRYTVQEVPLLFEKGFKAYALGLPTCAWGLLMFGVVAIAAGFLRKRPQRLL